MGLKYTSGGNFSQLSYQIGGAGPCLVLIHGFPQNSTLWKQVSHKLEESFTIIAPDLPGVGESRFSGAALTIEKMAESVKLILDTEHVNDIVIAGHSMGGYTALAFAELYPEKLKGLAMVHSLATADDEEKKENRRKAIALIEKGGKEAFIKQMMAGLFSEVFKQAHPEVIEQQIRQGSEVPAESLISFYNAMINRSDRQEVLSGANFPVQWIIGKEDKIAGADKVLQQTRLANVNFVSMYNDCSHMSMVEQPEELVKDLCLFAAYCFKRKGSNEVALQ